MSVSTAQPATHTLELTIPFRPDQPIDRLSRVINAMILVPSKMVCFNSQPVRVDDNPKYFIMGIR